MDRVNEGRISASRVGTFQVTFIGGSPHRAGVAGPDQSQSLTGEVSSGNFR